ncbi:MAG: RidA family protein [Dehalococcoidia bacterium]|nr:RidA family protein [Dehalococcoidia bacterium]|tara:strand:+ start:426 stop:890 length:465 start_codon:yes stop_codon:yes gene_type:complete
MVAEQKLHDMGLELGPVGTPLANFIPAVRTGNLLFVAGHIAGKPDGSVLNPGKVGRDVTEEQAYESAKLAMLNCLASIKQELGDLDRIKRIVKLLVMVNADPEFDRHFVVGNGASDLLVELYGDLGRHARSAVGMSSLPRKSCVEIEMIIEVEE